MEQIKLPRVDFAISRIGFGTSMLMSRLNRKESARLLDAALDGGITHFDTARLYGYGEAESVLGSTIASRRGRVTITTKVGILPPKRTPLLSIAKYIGRRVVAQVPQLRAKLRRRAEAMIQPGVFDIPAITSSLETSLRQLRTEYVDFLLLHECSQADLEKTELLEFLDATQRQGKVRHYGLAATPAVTELALVRFPEYAPVVQFANSVFEPTIRRLDLDDHPAIFAHSPLSVGFANLFSELSTRPAWAAQWSSRLGVDCQNRHALGRLALQYAMYSNPAGVVLFASSNEATIQANALTDAAAIQPEQMTLFEELVEESRSSPVGVKL
jgi:D-threo-aldose 1-dehydrogenase